jgi:hypothetical protein
MVIENKLGLLSRARRLEYGNHITLTVQFMPKEWDNDKLTQLLLLMKR